MKWQILANDRSGDIVKVLLNNRGLKSKKDIGEFLHPTNPLAYTPSDLLINPTQLKKLIERVKIAIKNNEAIIIYGDYDADGICATAILWEAINSLGGKVMPFIPLREKEGYGLSTEGVDTILGEEKYNIKNRGLIITVDSGIVAHEAVDYARKKGLDVIVVDHHEKSKKLPNAFAIIHTEKLCASGIAYFVGRILKKNDSLKESFFNNWLELAAIATVTDLMPLLGINRSIVKYGLEAINETSRPGIRALLSVAGIEKVGTYEIGYMIGPRLNASGRIENALSALRLLCTKNKSQAVDLAHLLNATNLDRQKMLEEQTIHALQLSLTSHHPENRIIVLSHESYHQGVIGLIAGKLVEHYYLPAIVIARADGISKASARSISGFNIIEAIRSTEKILVNAGGHPMAAGFTIETDKISNFKFQISNLARKKITKDLLERKLKIDCELDLSTIKLDFYLKLKSFEPYGIGNPEPVFASETIVESLRTVGQNNKHLKLQLESYDAIAFGRGELVSKIKVGDKIKIAYSVALDTYNGANHLQLKIRDILSEKWTI